MRVKQLPSTLPHDHAYLNGMVCHTCPRQKQRGRAPCCRARFRLATKLQLCRVLRYVLHSFPWAARHVPNSCTIVLVEDERPERERERARLRLAPVAPQHKPLPNHASVNRAGTCGAGAHICPLVRGNASRLAGSRCGQLGSPATALHRRRDTALDRLVGRRCIHADATRLLYLAAGEADVAHQGRCEQWGGPRLISAHRRLQLGLARKGVIEQAALASGWPGGVCGQEHRQPLRRDRGDGVVSLRQLTRHTGLGRVREESGAEGGGDADEDEHTEARNALLVL
eukprot:scaffold53077_cov64-Phaeocystis_antarctica.AAC.1